MRKAKISGCLLLLAFGLLSPLLPYETLGAQRGGAGDSLTFVCRELLGRPTGSSVALNLCADRDAEVVVEYGTQPSVYGGHSPARSIQAGVPATVTIAPLIPDTRYYYRVRYRAAGAAEYAVREEHSFHTARPRGSSFAFAVESDPHLDTMTSPPLYRRTLANILAGSPDFLIDLGDTFMSEKLPVIDELGITSRHLLLRTFFDTLGHSVPLMLAIGNHEGESGWMLNGTPDNVAVWASNTRKAYYPNPLPDGFYSGDTTAETYVGLRQNYYAWEWGNALFVVLDPYWYTSRKPSSSKDNWDWTLGRSQYDWFRKTLEESHAGFKFVFAHQIVGGNDTQGRGGIEAVPFYEMGGLNADSTWGFATHRSGWPEPLHQLMLRHHVTAFFHGHDHVFVRQDLDGIVYQELPQPGYFNYANPERSYTSTNQASLYGYAHGVIFPSSGYLRVAVTETLATVEYTRSYLPEHENAQRQNGEVAYSYTLRPYTPTTSVSRTEWAPEKVRLNQNYPNPFNPVTTISWDLAEPCHVALEVFDLLGRPVGVCVREQQAAGGHEVRWDASELPGGVYFYRLRAGERVLTKTMTLVK